MSNYVKLATDAGDQYLTSLAEIQENFLKASAAFTARFTAMPAIEMPAAFAEFPTAEELTDASFAFTQKLLKQQKGFTDRLFAASTPTPASKK